MSAQDGIKLLRECLEEVGVVAHSSEAARGFLTCKKMMLSAFDAEIKVGPAGAAFLQPLRDALKNGEDQVRALKGHKELLLDLQNALDREENAFFRLKQIREWLSRYGVHTPSCKIINDDNCVCGLTALLLAKE